MISLQEVQSIVAHEVRRDMGDKPAESLKVMAYAGLAEEAGEVLGILKREERSFGRDIEACCTTHKIEELGDVLWYLAMVCNVEGISLETVWEHNRTKLEERYG